MRTFANRLGASLIVVAALAAALPAHAANVDKDTFAHGEQSTFAIDFRSGMIFVPLRINGSQPLTFVLDSGSARMLIDRALAKTLGLDGEGSASMQGAGAGRIPVEFVENVNIGFPELESSGYQFATVDFGPLQKSLGVRVDGIIGYEFLQRFVVTVDYQSKTMTVAKPSAFHASASAESMPIEIRNKWAFVNAELELPGPVTVQDSFMIDSGSGDAVDHPIVMKLQSRKAEKSGVGFGTPVEGATARATSLRLGKYSLAGPTVACCGGSEETSKIIGNDVLKLFTVTFDYPDSRILIAPNADYARQAGNK